MTQASAIILARAGSRGLPGKNTALIAGRPCIAWTIDAALEASFISSVGVSSDCPEALELARRSGALAIERPAELAGDNATIDDAARHAHEIIGGEHVAILYANVPVRPDDIIDRAVELLASSGCDSVQSYAPVGKHHPLWTARLDERGVVRPWEGDVLNAGIFRRQDLPPAYIPDGAVIALTERALRLQVPGVVPGPHAFLGLDQRGVISPEGSTVDIDSSIDRRVAEAILSERAGLVP